MNRMAQSTPSHNRIQTVFIIPFAVMTITHFCFVMFMLPVIDLLKSFHYFEGLLLLFLLHIFVSIHGAAKIFIIDNVDAVTTARNKDHTCHGVGKGRRRPRFLVADGNLRKTIGETEEPTAAELSGHDDFPIVSVVVVMNAFVVALTGIGRLRRRHRTFCHDIDGRRMEVLCDGGDSILVYRTWEDVANVAVGAGVGICDCHG
mmetsp:Transcript_21982/g.46247  ORF Transcript_21982/g.46247 Transcript_21982/m.46247 type:complete len:203 (-) Transcript_21982:85-693(-)